MQALQQRIPYQLWRGRPPGLVSHSYHQCCFITISRINHFHAYTQFKKSPGRRFFHSTSSSLSTGPTAKAQPFTNILASDNPPPVQVASISPSGIELTDGLIIPGACIFLEGKVFLWDPPRTFWEGWKEEHFDVFEFVVPKPEILLLGTGKTIFQPPQFIRDHLNKMGTQLDVMDTRNACSTYNLLSEEGRRVAAALLPLTPRTWQKAQEFPKLKAASK
ncbi:NADH dehydrogenase 1 alpha subcomplex assembly factor 3 [Lentinula aff. detonsa]|nr:NADH dehydrogenase 1 alpha subcomplex assembly factor 3 [Lentinula aff. detonsa]